MLLIRLVVGVFFILTVLNSVVPSDKFDQVGIYIRSLNPMKEIPIEANSTVKDKPHYKQNPKDDPNHPDNIARAIIVDQAMTDMLAMQPDLESWTPEEIAELRIRVNAYVADVLILQQHD